MKLTCTVQTASLPGTGRNKTMGRCDKLNAMFFRFGYTRMNKECDGGAVFLVALRFTSYVRYVLARS